MNAVALIAPTGQTTLGELVVPSWLSKDEWLESHPDKRGIFEIMDIFGMAPTDFALVKTTLTSGVEEFYEAYLAGSAVPDPGQPHEGERLPMYAVVDRTVPATEIPDSITEEELNDL